MDSCGCQRVCSLRRSGLGILGSQPRARQAGREASRLGSEEQVGPAASPPRAAAIGAGRCQSRAGPAPRLAAPGAAARPRWEAAVAAEGTKFARLGRWAGGARDARGAGRCLKAAGGRHASLSALAAAIANFRLLACAQRQDSNYQPSPPPPLLLGRRQVFFFFLILWTGELFFAWKFTDFGVVFVSGRGGRGFLFIAAYFLFSGSQDFWSYMEGSQDGVHQENQNFSVHLRDFEWND